MMKIFNTLRRENELIIELKGMCPDNKIPKGLLQQGKKGIVGALDSFNTAKKFDIVNEMRPDE